MPYCIKCGTRLPDDESARFCPNCGASRAVQFPYEKRLKPTMELRQGLKVATLKSRILVMLMTFILCIAMTATGAMSRVESSEAQGLVGEIQNLPVEVQSIFGNNLMICMVMFVPVLGPYYGSMALYSTGRVFAAYSVASGANPLGLFLTVFGYPFFWLEYLSFSLAISESFWLIYSAARYRGRGLRNELSSAAIVMAICAVLLLIAAFDEIYMISSAST
jgi:hypothetical protein